MKLHRDGTIEGTPQEIAEYNKLQEKKELFKVIPPTPIRFMSAEEAVRELNRVAQKQFEGYAARNLH